MTIKEENSTKLFRLLALLFILLGAIICFIPFLLILSASLTNNESIIRDGFHLLPKVWSLQGYTTVFRFPDQVLRAYGVTVLTTVVGTCIGLFLMTMAGYVLQRRDFKYRNFFSFFIYFTTMFGGGLVPWYMLMTKYLKLTDTYTALIYPGLMTPFLIILMKNFIRASIPDEIIESAKIDGANDFLIYYRIVLQLSLPGIATVGFFLALQYWNDWFLTSLFINNTHLFQLQFYLYNLINAADSISRLGAGSGVNVAGDIPTESTKMAMAVIVMGPILFLYPLVQRYFVKSLTIGAVKG
ncbi:carbohydrate ABC transporter permease [Paenibacillus sp. OV219]|uniref:carbohydrate ABC transporter permease n=1 Tax=Paenibacillus sp. OV219 TaxID=1884377 RepID=UPI0008CF4C7E|nr:carbohydrate ABC transporter permease [Paenibacillus sp. OV219]SEN96858.1 putative aldouronate transport system permease protein [Paenibacillus sp. OV219]